jgi:hypothetical protein
MSVTVSVKVIRDTGGRGLAALQRRLRSGAARVLVGVPEGAGNEENGISLAQVAAINEFGGTIKTHERASRELKFSEHAFRNKEGFDSYRFAKKDSKRFILGRAKAYTQESFTIPERPFLRGGIRRNLPRLGRLSGRLLGQVARGATTMHGALETLGIDAAGAVKRYIVSGSFEPNAKSTIKKKGSSRPLIDDGQLRQSITSVVEGTR